ncbi:MAG TPA: EamA family transporter [Candidatus Polarisedimenticolia bacterium]|nr:EamA family transporter [Candidatus Polarisedimenticolia bacterium]
MTTLLLVAIIVLCFSFGDIALKRGMKEAGEISSLRLAVLDEVGGRAIRSPFVLLGGALEIVAFVTFLVALSRQDLSYVFPLTATSDIITTLAARYLLHERVTPRRWAGVLIVTLGIVLISMS